MQFHLEGYRPGDPAIAQPDATAASAAGSDVDVLIVGCGPTGLTLAAQLAMFPSIRTRIVDQRSGPLQVGQADGIACRSMEMFEAFGFADKVLKESYWVNETSFWRPDPQDASHIARSHRIQDVEDGLSEFPHTILNQARVHDFYLEAMRNSSTRLSPHYDRRLTHLRVQRGTPEAPVSVVLERTDAGHEGEIETVRARYVVGCDGARSAVRKSLGVVLRGDSANKVWGVMDILPVTDFTDIRLKCAIQSSAHGSMLIIPREGGYLVRAYIELDSLAASERVVDRQITPDALIAAARRILHPFSLDVKEIAWWSAYEIGQRVSDSFDDVAETDKGARDPRVFIAGDACHTHSPKAGQGMNVSMADAFNLGWKLAAVLRGQSRPELLRSYGQERRAKAQELIAFDRDMAELFSARPKAGAAAADPAEFQRYFARHGRYTAGVETCYGRSLVVADSSHQPLAKGLAVGKRFHSAPVVRLADAKPMHLGHAVKADGRWRLFAFAGRAGLDDLCRYLANDPLSPIVKYTPAGADLDSVIDLRAVLQQAHRDVDIAHLPPILLPRKGRYGLVDYEKVFCPDLRGGVDIFDIRGIDRVRGCLVVVRPDQFIADVLPLDATSRLVAFFAAFMQRQDARELHSS